VECEKPASSAARDVVNFIAENLADSFCFIVKSHTRNKWKLKTNCPLASIDVTTPGCMEFQRKRGSNPCKPACIYYASAAEFLSFVIEASSLSFGSVDPADA